MRAVVHQQDAGCSQVSAASPSGLHEADPHLAAFAALARELDPTGRFRNPFLERVLS